MFKKRNDKELALYYLRTFADTTRTPTLILDYKYKVIDANKAFYSVFAVTEEDTKGTLIYDLGNRQWDIPELKRLLENILPDKKELSDYEVIHEFPNIGAKVMLINARQLETTEQILLSFEDITLRRSVESRLADYTKKLEEGIIEKTEELRVRIEELSKINDLMVGREIKMTELKAQIKKLEDTEKLEEINKNKS